MRVRFEVKWPVLCWFILCGCGPLPRDPEHTLERVQNQHRVRVGVVESPPWVTRINGQPGGVEIELVQGFSRSLGATPQWEWGADERHLQALEHFQLDLAVGNLDAKTPWSQHVGLTKPYFEDHVMAVPPGENAWLKRLSEYLFLRKASVRSLLRASPAEQ